VEECKTSEVVRLYGDQLSQLKIMGFTSDPEM
jgi:hypothetical protein